MRKLFWLRDGLVVSGEGMFGSGLHELQSPAMAPETRISSRALARDCWSAIGLGEAKSAGENWDAAIVMARSSLQAALRDQGAVGQKL